MKKIAFIGTFIRDKIIPLQGEITQSIGGLYHGLAAAAFSAKDDFLIYPVANIGKDFASVLLPVLQKLPRLDLQYVEMVEQCNTAVTLKYISESERQETSTRFMPAISIEKLAGIIGFSAVHINMISGADIELEALADFRKQFKNIICLDFHTLAQGIDACGKRFPQRPEKWQNWIRCADIVQMNENEAAILSSSPIEKEPQKLSEFLETILQLGPQAAVITLGAKGAIVGKRMRFDQMEIRHIQPPMTEHSIVDIIGCGDTFGAVFLLNYLRINDLWAAVRKALQIASLNATFMGSITKSIFEERILPYAES